MSPRLTLVCAAATLSCGVGSRGGVHHAAVPVPDDDPPRAAHEPAPLHQRAPEDSLGGELGRYQLTYYWIAEELTPGRGTVLRDPSCRPLARVSRSFARRLRREGTGRLGDGRLLNVTRRCKCGSVCFFDAEEHGSAWGLGVQNRPLEPFRSIAVDPRRVRIGSWLYVAELDGVRMPGDGSYGGFVHDGCLRADDRGGGVRGRQLDFFAGLRRHYRTLQGAHRFRRVTVREGGAHCRRHRNGDGTAVASLSLTDRRRPTRLR